MIILGIDPGVATVGFGVIVLEGIRPSLLQCGAITTAAKLPLSTRLLQISTDLEVLIGEFRPDVMAVEELFFNTNVTTGIAVAHGRGAVLLTAEKCALPVFEYTPLQVKQAVTGYGRASKKQVMAMTQRLLNLTAVPRPDDAADALAVALCHGRSCTSRLNEAMLQFAQK